MGHIDLHGSTTKGGKSLHLGTNKIIAADDKKARRYHIAVLRCHRVLIFPEQPVGCSINDIGNSHKIFTEELEHK